MKRPGHRFSRLGPRCLDFEAKEETVQDPLALLVQVQAAQKAVRELIWLDVAYFHGDSRVEVCPA
jgi:hypothetical protein